MKILWLVNIPLPEVSIMLGDKPSPFGGWLIKAAEELSKQKDIELFILFPRKGVTDFTRYAGENITYYAFKPVQDSDKKIIRYNLNFRKIIEEVNPDVVHIYGTEMAHSLSMVNTCKEKHVKTVISIQGLVSIISKHTFSTLPFKIVYGFTLRNILRLDNVKGLKRLFEKRGDNEIKAIKGVKHIIGRTTWDRASTAQINPDAKYHFCNEVLREEFYKHKWDINRCQEFSLFISQAHYPIKGLHYVLSAMPEILKKYPKTKLYISGKDITKTNTLFDKLLITNYGRYLKKLIKKFDIEKNVIFTGPLSEKQMCERFLQSNIFISASTIENESNSLSEARILGVPTIASYVGGVIDRVKHYEDGILYQHDAPYMLAHHVGEIFKKKELAISFSEKARKHSLLIHDLDRNTNRIIKIYKDIIDEP
ncbi:glycosyltransferase [Planococcus salinus]|uniref:Glycosyltransferase n=1 Tax=Planococcus salinus TaxID=1848460 RepID=A0A3M8P7M5_9BACL|nr:glycosyltransferase [Planococcus salinus]RNF39622.1 glycosyltransferase [Planococcus salinus]